MKKILKFNNLFFIITVIIAIATNWSWYGCVLLAVASILILIDVVPKIVEEVRRGKKS